MTVLRGWADRRQELVQAPAVDGRSLEQRAHIDLGLPGVTDYINQKRVVVREVVVEGYESRTFCA